VLLGADYYGTDAEAPTLASGPKLGIGQDVELDRVIVDKNARIGDGVRLVNAASSSCRRTGSCRQARWPERLAQQSRLSRTHNRCVPSTEPSWPWLG
jgi:hypothetical protein